VQIVQGLADGDLVVTEGTQKLRDGARVQVATGSAAAPPVTVKQP
jgi:hypothetical protein